MHPAFVYMPGGRLGISELSAARLDGHLVELGEGYMPADLVDDANTRALSVAAVVPRNTAASGPTAAWIHGAGDMPPAIHHVRRAVEHRIRVPITTRLVLHDTPVPLSDLRTMGGIPVVSSVRTMLDLSLGLHRDESLRHWMVLLADIDPSLIGAALARMAPLTRVPGTRAGRAALQRLGVRTT